MSARWRSLVPHFPEYTRATGFTSRPRFHTLASVEDVRDRPLRAEAANSFHWLCSTPLPSSIHQPFY